MTRFGNVGSHRITSCMRDNKADSQRSQGRPVAAGSRRSRAINHQLPARYSNTFAFRFACMDFGLRQRHVAVWPPALHIHHCSLYRQAWKRYCWCVASIFVVGIFFIRLLNKTMPPRVVATDCMCKIHLGSGIKKCLPRLRS